MKPIKSMKPKVKNGKVQPKKKSKKVMEAEEAVSAFEDMRDSYLARQAEFSETFPEAHAALEDIKRMEDELRDQASACKDLVRAAKVSIGEFVCIPKSTAEGYIGEKLLGVLAEQSSPHDTGVLFRELYKRGLFEKISVNKDAAKVIRSSDPAMRKKLESAWDKGGTPLTASVTPPKF